MRDARPSSSLSLRVTMADGELGVVLRTTPLRESDLLVVLYTDEHGRVAAVARGARKSQRRFAGALQLLVLGRYQLGRRPRGELWSLECAEIEREWTRSRATSSRSRTRATSPSWSARCCRPRRPSPHALELIVALWDSARRRRAVAGGAARGRARAARSRAVIGPRSMRARRAARTELDAARCSIRRAAARSAGAARRPAAAPACGRSTPATLAYLRAVAARRGAGGGARARYRSAVRSRPTARPRATR